MIYLGHPSKDYTQELQSEIAVYASQFPLQGKVTPRVLFTSEGQRNQLVPVLSNEDSTLRTHIGASLVHGMGEAAFTAAADGALGKFIAQHGLVARRRHASQLEVLASHESRQVDRPWPVESHDRERCGGKARKTEITSLRQSLSNSVRGLPGPSFVLLIV
mmetsp:Transcript_9034/g.22988  ORF Transcript_9034/g.22988 Transcript_9034/m.22988 type:complete len:161 (-) Transcript_9034:568-1050(-)